MEHTQPRPVFDFFSKLLYLFSTRSIFLPVYDDLLDQLMMLDVKDTQFS